MVSVRLLGQRELAVASCTPFAETATGPGGEDEEATSRFSVQLTSRVRMHCYGACM